MKKKLTTTLMMIAAATALTACGSDSEFTDEEIADLERVDEMFTYDDDIRQVEETRYTETALPLMHADHSRVPLTLEESLAACDDMRVSVESDYLVGQAEPEDPEKYLASAGVLYSNMCEL